MQSLDDLFDDAEDQAPPAAYNWEQEEEEQEGGNMLLMAGTGAGDEAVDLMVQDGNPLETLPLEEGGGGGGGAGLKKRRIQAPKYDASVLLSEQGLPYIHTHARKNIVFKGKGHEEEDLKRFLFFYQMWFHGLDHRMSFDMAIKRTEKLCKEKRLKIFQHVCLSEERRRKNQTMLTRDEEDDGEGLDHNDDVYHRYNNNNNGWEGTNDGQREDIGNDHARESKGRRRNMIVDDNDYEHNQDGSTTTTTAATAHPSSSSSSLSSIPLPPPAPAQTLDTEVQARIAANKARALAKLAEKRKFMTARLEHIDQQNNGVDGGEAGKMTSQTQQQQQQQQSSSSSTMEEDLDEEERIMMEMERSGNPTPQEEDDDSPLF